jgi:GT2 family glycosyltransferase
VLICPVADADVDQPAARRLPFPVTIVRGEPGSSHQRNAILRNVEDADAIVFLDDDFFPAESYLANVATLLADNPAVMVATGTLVADGIHGPGLTPDDARTLLVARTAPLGSGLMPYYGAYGCNMVVRLDPVREHGVVFDEALPLYAWQEDIDFSRQMARFGRVVKAEALSGVHLGAKRGRVSGVKFGYSQVANPIYLVRKGTLSVAFGGRTMAKNLLANLARAHRREPHIDRLGRLKGNALALLDLLRGRLHPSRVLEIRD